MASSTEDEPLRHTKSVSSGSAQRSLSLSFLTQIMPFWLIFELRKLPDHRLEHPKGVGLNVRQALWANLLHEGGIDWDQQ